VYKVSESWLQGSDLDTIDFMQKLPVVAGFNDVVSVTVNWNGAAKTVVKSDPTKTVGDSIWKFGDKDLEGSAASTFLDKVILMSTNELVKPSSDVKQDNPELKLELKLNKDGAESTNSYLGKVEGETVWIMKTGDAWAYAIPKTKVQEMFDSLKIDE